MKLHYYPETDSLYIELKADSGVETREVVPGLSVGVGAECRHCEERSDDAIQAAAAPYDDGSLRFARNDAGEAGSRRVRRR
jgi:hypothetical protein